MPQQPCWKFLLLLCASMCRCSYVHIPGTAVMVEYVVVLLWNGCTAGPVCSGVLVSCCSAFRRASGGHKGGHMTGPCKAELVTPTVPLQTHIPLASFCLFIVSPLLSTVADMALSLMFLSLLVSGSRSISHISELETTQQVHVLPQGQHGHFYTPFSAKLCADITHYHPPAHTMFGSLFNIYMTMQ